MKKPFRLLLPGLLLCILYPAAGAMFGRSAAPITFRMVEIDPNLGIGYAVAVAEMNGDGKPDVIAVNEKQLLWYENPSWRKHVIVAEGTTQRDNVCVAADDLNGDGKAELALGAFWQPSNTQNSGSVHYLARPSDPTQIWKAMPLEPEPTVHRMRWVDVDGDGKKELVVVPLQGRGTRGPDWQGNGVRILAYRPPADPASGPWKTELIDDTLHVSHNFTPVQWDADPAVELLVASFEGLHLMDRSATGAWGRTRVAEGDQVSRPNRGCSEVRVGRLPGRDRLLATVEPWHGNSIVIYRSPRPGAAEGLWQRQVLDDTIRGGHGLWCADLDGDGVDEVVAGWRDASPTQKVGVRAYRLTDAAAGRWERLTVDDGGMACEDLTAADLNGDGRIDLAASARSTHNLRVYFNNPG